MNWMDADRWKELADGRGLKLPQWRMVCTRGSMSSWLKKLGISATAYLAWQGGGKLGDWRAMNPAWPLRAWVGLMLEWQDATGLAEGKGAG